MNSKKVITCVVCPSANILFIFLNILFSQSIIKSIYPLMKGGLDA
jgi:hypothetical protein